MSTLPVRTAAPPRIVALGPWVWLAIPVILALALYAPLAPGLVAEWSEFPTLSHGFAIPAIAVYLLWIRRDRLRAGPVEGALWGLPVLVLGLAVFALGTIGEEPFLARVSLPLTLLGLTLFVAGQVVARQAWIGIAYLVFMVPLPYATLKLITTRSRLLDAHASAEGLRWLGIPVHQDGVMLHLPNITLEVADDCSSIPAIAALLALGVVYACLGHRPWPQRAALILATVPLAVSANIIRIVGQSAAAYWLGPWTLGTFYHKFSGTVTFLLTFLLLAALDRALALVARAVGR